MNLNKYVIIAIYAIVAMVIFTPLYAEDIDNVTVMSSSDTITINENSYTGNVITITDDNYDDYFDIYSGEMFPDTNINDGDIIRIGNVTDKAFVINKQLEITTIHNGDVIKNGYVKLVKGSDGSSVHGLTIINDKAHYVVDGIQSIDLNGIGLFYTNNNYICNNSVQLAECRGVFALPMGASSNNKIYKNKFVSTMSTCVPMSECDNNIFDGNYFQSTLANVIYYNPWGHADYFGGHGVCYNNTFSNNYMCSLNRNSEWVIGMSLLSNCNVYIVNNTITNVYDGIRGLGSNSIVKGNTIKSIESLGLSVNSDNLTIENNTFIDMTMAIAVLNDNIVVKNNIITNSSIGIWVFGENASLISNTISLVDGYYAVNVESENAVILNNNIKVSNFGEGIRVAKTNTSILNNTIQTAVDSGIYILSSNNVISGNRISSNLYGVYVDAASEVYYYTRGVLKGLYYVKINQGRLNYNNISDNVINTKSYGIYLVGTVYNTTIAYNNITTNAAIGIVENITDPFSNIVRDNIVNGVFLNYSGIVISDDNFYAYFNENGYFKFDNIKSIVLVITKLSNKDMVINQKMTILNGGSVNILSNVTLYLVSGASGTSIKLLNFKNTDKNAIVLNDVNDVTLEQINMMLTSKMKDVFGISINSSNNINIVSNDLYVTGENRLIQGILLSHSNNLTINNNSVILEGNKTAKGIVINSVNVSNLVNNTIHIQGNGVFDIVLVDNSNDLNISYNNFIARSTKVVSPLEISNSNNFTMDNNNISAFANLVKSLNFSNNSNILLNFTFIKLIGASKSSATFVNKGLNNVEVINSIIYSNALKLIDGNIILNKNKYVIYDGNIETFFDSHGIFSNLSITQRDTLLFDNLKLKHYNLIFNQVVTLDSYYKTSVIDATLNFNSKSSNSTIGNLNFDLVGNTAFYLNFARNITIENVNINLISSKDVSAIIITGESFDNLINNNTINMKGSASLTGITIYNYYDGYYGLSPKNNIISNNNIIIDSTRDVIGIYIAMADNTIIRDNNIKLTAGNIAYGVYNIYSPDFKVFMSTIWTANTKIIHNFIDARGSIVCLINSIEAKNTLVDSNILIATADDGSYGYFGYKTSGDIIRYNDFTINGTLNNRPLAPNVGQTGIYLSSGSSNVLILENSIISNYTSGNEYAIYVDADSNKISIVDNYLISDNWNRYSDNAIYAPSANLTNNELYYVYVSPDGSDELGNGSINNPFRTIKYALSKVINKGIVYVIAGKYIESNIIISKVVTIKGLGEVIVNCEASLFNITKSGSLKVYNIKFMNAYSVSGSTFYNLGKLYLENVSIVNSTALTYGGAIVNYGELVIVNSIFSLNKAKNGGVIANYNKLDIKSSNFTNNSCFIKGSGGAIYNLGKGTLTIDNCNFADNKVDAEYLLEADDFGVRLGSGGAIYNRGDLYIYNSNFTSNRAFNWGGAIVSITDVKKHNLKVINSIFDKNTCFAGGGGAIFITNANADIANSSFTLNAIGSDSGGALYFTKSNAKIYNSTFFKNSASFSGGAIDAWRSNITMDLCNITDNNAEHGGALCFYGERVGNHVTGTLNIYNSTIYDNKGFYTGGAFYVKDLNMNVKNSNIYGNFGGDGKNSISVDIFYPIKPVNNIDLNGNWWGSNDGPGEDVWLNAQYYREWVKDKISWPTFSPSNPDNNPNNPGNNPRPGQSTNNPINGPSTGGLLTPGSNSGGFGTGIGSGTGNGFGFGNGNGRGSGSGSSNGGSSGNNGGRLGSGSGFNGTVYSNQGSLGDLGSSSSGAGGSDAGSSSQSSNMMYELNKNIKKVLSDDNVMYGIVFLAIILLLIIFGYKRNSKKEDE